MEQLHLPEDEPSRSPLHDGQYAKDFEFEWRKINDDVLRREILKEAMLYHPDQHLKQLYTDSCPSRSVRLLKRGETQLPDEEVSTDAGSCYSNDTATPSSSAPHTQILSRIREGSKESCALVCPEEHQVSKIFFEAQRNLEAARLLLSQVYEGALQRCDDLPVDEAARLFLSQVYEEALQRCSCLCRDDEDHS